MVNVEITPRIGVPIVPSADMGNTAIADRAPFLTPFQHLAKRSGAFGGIVGREEEAVFAMRHQFAVSAHI